jgi:hypothetical protein
MALALKDRVKETTTTTGTGTVTLLGASTGFQSFAAVGNGNTTYYTIAGQGTSEWEVGIGTYTSSGTTLSRTTVLASSNSGSLVNFSAGTKDVFVTYPAARTVNYEGTGVFVLLGTGTALSGATNPILAMSGSSTGYIQGYIINSTNGTSSSSDLVAYPHNGTDTHGFVDVGVNSLSYADTTYTVTGPNESYLFGSAPSGAGTTGNLVYATDSTGSANAHQFYVGGFTQAKTAWKAQIDSTGLKATQVNATNGIIANSKTVSANYTIASGDSAMSTGPMTVASGITVTVSSGSRWVVL